MKRATREWVRKAEADHRSAGSLAHETKPVHDQVCFLAQQSAEKYLKALLEELGLTIPKSHHLVEILDLLTPHHRSLGRYRRGLRFLTFFAVATRGIQAKTPGSARRPRRCAGKATYATLAERSSEFAHRARRARRPDESSP